jgi:hypothetical protein
MDAVKIQFFEDYQNGQFAYSDADEEALEKKKLKNCTLPEIMTGQVMSIVDSMPVLIKVILKRKPPNMTGKSSLELEIQVKDKGTGISLKDIENMRNIGKSRNAMQRKQIELMPEWLKPTGAFGIGMQSVFGFLKDGKDRFEAITRSMEDHICRRLYFKSTIDEGSLLSIKKQIPGLLSTQYGTTIIVKKSLDDADNGMSSQRNIVDPFSPFYSRYLKEIYKYIAECFTSDLFPIKVVFSIEDEADKAAGKPETPVEPIILEPFFKRFLSSEYGCGWPLIIKPDAQDRQFTIDAFNPEDQVYVRLAFNPKLGASMPLGTSKLYYRGMLVSERSSYQPDLRFPFVDAEIYVWTGDATNLLKISRRGLLKGNEKKDGQTSTELIAKVKKTVYRAIEIMLTNWDEALAAKTGELYWKEEAMKCLQISGSNLPLALSYYYILLHTQQMKNAVKSLTSSGIALYMDTIRSTIKDQLISYAMSVLNYTGCRYVRETSLLNTSLLDFDQVWFIPDSHAAYTYSNINDRNGNLELPQQVIPDFLSDMLDSVFLQEIRLIRLDDKDVPLYRLGLFRQTSFEMHDEEQDRWIQSAVYDALHDGSIADSRAVVPGLRRYGCLSVESVPRGLAIGVLQLCGNYLILPFTNKEIVRLKESIGICDAVIDSIHAGLAYANLISFVEDKQIASPKKPAKSIIDEYKKLEAFIVDLINRMQT